MPIGEATTQLTVRSGQGDYDVVACNSLSDAAAPTQIEDCFTIIDQRVYELYPELARVFDPARTHLLTAAEEEKTLQGVERACLFLQKGAASKRSHLVVVGGGITQDIGTFVAHVYYRGIPFTYVPTTLLAMADSCIGAKCAVNLGEFKNQLGFFQSPKRVAIWTGFLDSLSVEDVRSGFGEIVKLAIVSGREDYDWLESFLSNNGFSLHGASEAIFRSLETKRRVIEEDEYEGGLRKTLNYGHTFGHALESLTHHEVPHGLAVAWGMDVANYVALRLGILDAGTYERIHALLARHFGTYVHMPYDSAALIAAMRRDKKAAGDSVTLVLPEKLGLLQLVPKKLDSELESYVAEYMCERDIFARVTKA